MNNVTMADGFVVQQSKIANRIKVSTFYLLNIIHLLRNIQYEIFHLKGVLCLLPFII